MTICEREELLLDLLRSGRELADTELGSHVAECASCADLVAAASAILDEHHTLTREANVPTSGAVWWRMQRRVRQEAMRNAARTVTAVQFGTVAAAIAIAVAIVGFTTDWRAWLRALAANAHIPDLPTLAQWSLPLSIAVVACLFVAPVVVYLSLARD